MYKAGYCLLQLFVTTFYIAQQSILLSGLGLYVSPLLSSFGGWRMLDCLSLYSQCVALGFVSSFRRFVLCVYVVSWYVPKILLGVTGTGLFRVGRRIDKEVVVVGAGGAT